MAGHANIWNFALGCFLIAAAITLSVLSWGALGNLFAEYQDNPSRTYAALGGGLLVLAVGSGACGVALIRQVLKH